MIISNFFFSISLICVLQSIFLIKFLTLGILFSKVVRVALVVKLVILVTSSLTSFILALREALVAKLVISDILSSICLILALYASFLTTSFFTSSLNLLKSTETITNLSTSNLSTLFIYFFSSCLNQLVHFSIYQYLIYLHYILNQLNYLFSKFYVSIPVAFFKSTFVA